MKTYMLKYAVPKSTGETLSGCHRFTKTEDIYYRYISVTMRSTPGHAVRQSDLPAKYLVSVS